MTLFFFKHFFGDSAKGFTRISKSEAKHLSFSTVFCMSDDEERV